MGRRKPRGKGALVSNAGDKEQVRRAAKSEKQRRAEQLNDLHAVLQTAEGRRLLWRYIKRCGVWEPSFRENPLVMAKNEGERGIGLMLVGECEEADPEAMAKMRAEAVQEQQFEIPPEPEKGGEGKVKTEKDGEEE